MLPQRLRDLLLRHFSVDDLRTGCVLNSLAQGLRTATVLGRPHLDPATQEKDLDRLVSALGTFNREERLEPADEIRD